MVAEECGFFLVVGDDCTRGFEQGNSVFFFFLSPFMLLIFCQKVWGFVS